MKVFLDANVLVAAFATRGLCEDVLKTVLTEHELVVGVQVIDELERILVDKLKLRPAKARTISAFIKSESQVIDPSEPASWPERDPDDRWVVAAALGSEAEILVTGDRDLLDAADRSPIPIVSPREFWERLR
jgi:putative PIN family toxin of toxin-antitoxin system